jgi:hypothetical protein
MLYPKSNYSKAAVALYKYTKSGLQCPRVFLGFFWPDNCNFDKIFTTIDKLGKELWYEAHFCTWDYSAGVVGLRLCGAG